MLFAEYVVKEIKYAKPEKIVTAPESSINFTLINVIIFSIFCLANHN
jgi:hypothetical protein